MNILEDAIIYATRLHEGKMRKVDQTPYILHPLEVAQIISTLTNDLEVIAAGVLHDVVEDTDGTLDEIEERFGERVAALVKSETENKYPGQNSADTWKRRKEESLVGLKKSTDPGVKMLWLGDKLSNIRSLAGNYSAHGEDVWQNFNQKDPLMHRWYYKTIAEYIEYELNRTGAYKEFIKHLNFLWPGTYDSDKTRYKKYKEVSMEGCRLIGQGEKGDVYRYDDELIIKVYKENNTYKDVEREIALCRKAFVMGLPTPISFGIVAVGNRYGAMFELVDSYAVSRYIASDSEKVGKFAKLMSDMAKKLHDTEADDDSFPEASNLVKKWVNEGLGIVDEPLAKKIIALIDALPETKHLVHGDFHTGNVIIQNDEPLIIDLDHLSTGHPIVDLSGIYLSYVAMGDYSAEESRRFMGFPYEVSLKFFECFMHEYFGTEDESVLEPITRKMELISCVRMLRKLYRKQNRTEADEAKIKEYIERIRELLDVVDDFLIER
ncbi:MAG: HD domain-containing protein [Lachnospiraceae bacterium]|nr:HD domain-containing protein [Lachnospiraceae bacterium]